jgi:hypothetical protein
MSHTHKCMSCGESWQCPQSPGDCKANESVLPSLVLRGPNGPQMFDHICQRKPRSETASREERLESALRVVEASLSLRVNTIRRRVDGKPLIDIVREALNGK